ncbi:MAG: hypothetical protein K6E59_04250 [Bacilli bacterium]|nr:hypothetical protein [Bacilli bacterium]
MKYWYNKDMAESSKRIQELLTKEVYSRYELYDVIYRVYPGYSENSCNWVIGLLVSDHVLQPLGNGVFAHWKEPFSYPLDPVSVSLLDKLRERFPYSDFAGVTTTSLNEILMGVDEHKALLLQVSKRDLFPAYLALREWTKREVMLNPTPREIEYYLRDNSIILKPLFSKSPVTQDGLYTAEKLLVDLLCDKTLRTMYPYVSNEDVVQNICEEKNVNIITTLNYARRRGKYDGMVALFQGVYAPEVLRKVMEGKE